MGGVEAGESVPMTIQRGAERLDVTLQAISKPPTWRVEKGETAGVTSVGLTLSAITQKIREKLELRWSSTGVAVIQVDPAKLPKTLKLALGDVIVQVNQDAVWSPNQVIDHLRAATEAKRRALLLLVEGTGDFASSCCPSPSDPSGDQERPARAAATASLKVSIEAAPGISLSPMMNAGVPRISSFWATA